MVVFKEKEPVSWVCLPTIQNFAASNTDGWGRALFLPLWTQILLHTWQHEMTTDCHHICAAAVVLPQLLAHLSERGHSDGSFGNLFSQI